MLYQLQREITSISQDTDTVMVYFTKLKKLWDQYTSLVPLPVCTCDIGKVVLENDMQTKLMQFLMGLNDTYDNVGNQILLLEPLPTIK